MSAAKKARTVAKAGERTFKIQVRGQTGAIPQIGLGTAGLKGDSAFKGVTAALDAGYRHIDTALLYGNHKEVGEAIAAHGVPRDQIWLTSKVGFFPERPKGFDGEIYWYRDDNVKGGEAASIVLALEQLQVDFVDLMLIHNPCSNPSEYTSAGLPHFFELFGFQKSENAITGALTLPDKTPVRKVILDAKRALAKEGADPTNGRKARAASWKNLEAALAAGKCKYIGVSNYPWQALLEMKEYATVMPAVNQLELHPRYASPKLQEVAKELGVVLTGYGTGHSVMIEGSKGVAAIAKKHGVSAIQVVMRWTNQLGVVTLPRSDKPGHQLENLEIFDFELDADDMAALGAMNEDYPYYWDPTPTTYNCPTF